MCEFTIADNWTIQSIILDDLTINSFQMQTPAEWEKYKSQWSEEISEHHNTIDAAVLIGADKPGLFPLHEKNSSGIPIEKATAILMRSWITSRLIAFGHNLENKHKVTSSMNCTPVEQSHDEIITIQSEEDNSNYNSENDGEMYNHTVQFHTPTSFKYQFNVNQSTSPNTNKSRHSDDKMNDNDNDNVRQWEVIP